MEQDVLRLSSDGARGDYYFGRSVGIHNNTLVVGTATTGVSDAVSVFARDVRTGTWSEQFKLRPSDGSDGDRFGWNVGIYSDTVIASANADYGSVYLFCYFSCSLLFGSFSLLFLFEIIMYILSRVVTILMYIHLNGHHSPNFLSYIVHYTSTTSCF